MNIYKIVIVPSFVIDRIKKEKQRNKERHAAILNEYFIKMECQQNKKHENS